MNVLQPKKTCKGPLTVAPSCNYCNYMKARLIRIGNSRGIRIPQELVQVYNLREGAELDLEERREGILVRVAEAPVGMIPWDTAYQEMAAEGAEEKEWSAWDVTSGDGNDG
jgi:antitoxin MazE